MPFAHRTHVSPEVVRLGALDGQRDVAGPVGDGVARGAVLESFVFDVVTQQLVVRTPPLHGQLRDVSVVLIVVRTRQSHPLAGPTEHLHDAAWGQKRPRFSKSINNESKR